MKGAFERAACTREAVERLLTGCIFCGYIGKVNLKTEAAARSCRALADGRAHKSRTGMPVPVPISLFIASRVRICSSSRAHDTHCYTRGRARPQAADAKVTGGRRQGSMAWDKGSWAADGRLFMGGRSEGSMADKASLLDVLNRA